MTKLQIIDAHHHLAELTHSYPWLEGPAQPFKYHGDDRPLRKSYLLADYIRDTADYDLLASVHIENGAADALWETSWIESVSKAMGLPTVHVAKVALLDPAAPELLAAHTKKTLVVGIRDILNWHPDPTYTHTPRADIIIDPIWRANFALLHTFGLSFDLQVFPSQLLEATELAKEHPETTIILDHAGMPIGRDRESRGEWAKGMKALAGCPNVFVKVSALGTNDHTWTKQSIEPFVTETINIFGSNRTMFGSNFPVDSLYSTFRYLFESFEEITSTLNASERYELFVAAAARAYRIPIEKEQED
jgi:predicted TIM-barrel fold metal-dependent hydrolase